MRIPCKFNVQVAGLGYLEETGNADIKENTKLELPVWLAGILSGIPIMSEEGEEVRLLDLLPPDAFNKKIINSIKSNSVNLSLRSVLPNFYSLAERWCFWFEDAAFVEIIQQMLKDRSVVMNDYSFNLNSTNSSNNDEISRFVHSLDNLEKEIFMVCVASHKDAKQWLNS
ncbi:DNA replication protein [Saccharomycopsis crataegensis]|uniref:DNA replication complex GINS protein PSF3 n=1 Tax=Saccharomycopsis crataegensis TaxID=43959 RepID=A0AAV5QUL1_9ASCO|nr:DNA replication protein [Saccharomycopsis crataegensis]